MVSDTSARLLSGLSLLVVGGGIAVALASAGVEPVAAVVLGVPFGAVAKVHYTLPFTDAFDYETYAAETGRYRRVGESIAATAVAGLLAAALGYGFLRATESWGLVVSAAVAGTVALLVPLFVGRVVLFRMNREYIETGTSTATG